MRVFTRHGAGGNHLAIHDGLLSDDDMQAAAAVLGYSETIYVGHPGDDGTVPVRIFTPGAELPFAGHPLVGATWHLAASGAAARLRCGIGVVAGRRTGGDGATVHVAYLPIVEAEPVSAGVASWVARMPLPYEVLQLASPDDVASYQPTDRPDHRLVWANGEGGRSDVVRARFFASGLGVDEDPATGSAAVALAAVLRHEGTTAGEVTIHQGAEIGAPSRIDLSWTPTATVIGGTVAEDGQRTVSVRRGS